eukprot:2784271-Prymnesium_polylepis.1
MARLPAQAAALGWSSSCGVSSFGYSGTIAHAVASALDLLTPLLPLVVPLLTFQRRAVPWRGLPPQPDRKTLRAKRVLPQMAHSVKPKDGLAAAPS